MMLPIAILMLQLAPVIVIHMYKPFLYRGLVSLRPYYFHIRSFLLYADSTSLIYLSIAIVIVHLYFISFPFHLILSTSTGRTGRRKEIRNSSTEPLNPLNCVV